MSFLALYSLYLLMVCWCLTAVCWMITRHYRFHDVYKSVMRMNNNMKGSATHDEGFDARIDLLESRADLYEARHNYGGE